MYVDVCTVMLILLTNNMLKVRFADIVSERLFFSWLCERRENIAVYHLANIGMLLSNALRTF